MARKYGKNATTKNNVLKLVEALLSLADEEVSVPRDKLKATFYLEWIKEDELLVSGKVQQKRNNRIETVEKGITKEDLWVLVECLGEALKLSQPKDEKQKPTQAERKADAVQDVIDCLKDLELLDDKRKITNSPYWKFHLKLKHQTKKEENLKLVYDQWKIKFGSIAAEASPEVVVTKNKFPDWRGICGQMLAEQKQLTTNAFTNADGVSLQREEIYVPLAIVERKPPKPQSRNPQEEKEEEKLIPITEESFFEEVLRSGQSSSQGRRIAVIGEPGSGKTTRLQKIADWILEQGLGLPIWVSLADLTQPTIAQYIEEFWLKQTGQSLTIEALTQQKDQIWLLLDGVDEMTSSVETRHVSALWGGWLQGVRVVVSCRVNVWEADKNAFSGFDVFRNLEFSPEQVRDYIRCWFAGAGDGATGEDLDRALTQSENYRLKELIQNPLRLWMLCHIQYKNRGGLPETQAELYGQFVDRVYDWKADEEILDQREAIDAALAKLALAAMEQQDEVSRFRLRESWVVKKLGSRQIFEAVKRLGWLNRVERSPEAICVFYHATFQEYFAALGVEDWDYFLPRDHESSPVVGKKYRIFEPQWRQVILLWLGREDIADTEKEEFIEKLVNFDDGCGEFYKYRAYLLATSGTSEYRNYTLIQEIVSTVFGLYCSKISSLADAANKALIETNRTRAIDWLIKTIIEFVTEQTLSYPTVNFKNFDSKINYICRRLYIPSLNLLNLTKALGELEPHNQLANDILHQLAKIGYDLSVRRNAVISLFKISKYLPSAITNDFIKYLVSLSDPRNGSAASIEAVWHLCLIEKAELISSDFVFKAFASAFSKFAFTICWDIAKTLPPVHKKTVISGIMEFIDTYSLNSPMDSEICEAVWCLWQIESSTSQFTTNILTEIIHKSDDICARQKAAEILGLIDPINLLSRQTLLQILKGDKNYSPDIVLASLLKINHYDEITPESLLRVIKLNSPELNLFLEKVSVVTFEEKQVSEIIYQLNIYLSNNKHRNNIDCCRSLLFSYSQIINYHDFYQAWHHPSILKS